MVAALVGLELHATRAEFHAALRSCAPILRERLGVILNQRDPGDLKAFEHSIDALLSAASPVDDPDWCRWAKLFADEKAAVALFGF
jgi:hypothetical protein